MIYLDNAATTPVSSLVLQEMLPVFTTEYGNNLSLHTVGQKAGALVETARSRIANAIAARPDEIIFTSGGTEADNLAILGLARANRHKGKHIITSQIEHPAVLQACKQLEREGFDVTYLSVDQDGLINFSQLIDSFRYDTILVSVMMANNEIGTIQNIRAIAKIVKDKSILFHTDAVQAVGKVSIHVKQLGCDALSLSSHKINGPKGAGALYLRKGIAIEPVILGGNQEGLKRGGTVNVPNIVGFGKAIELAVRDLSTTNQKLKMIRDYFVKCVLEKIEHVKVNGHPQQRVAGIVSLSFELIEGESLLYLLDFAGICVSTGSACSSGNLKNSHVLKAIGLSDEIAQGTIRFSFGKNISKEDVDYTVQELVKAVEKLRYISPLKRAKKGARD